MAFDRDQAGMEVPEGTSYLDLTRCAPTLALEPGDLGAAWRAVAPDGQEAVGEGVQASVCPVAVALHHLFGEPVPVRTARGFAHPRAGRYYVDGQCVYDARGWRVWRLPGWAVEFVKRLDARFGGCGLVPRDEALALMAGAVADAAEGEIGA